MKMRTEKVNRIVGVVGMSICGLWPTDWNNKTFLEGIEAEWLYIFFFYAC